MTRRATIWQWGQAGWRALYHQGTIVTAEEDDMAPLSGGRALAAGCGLFLNAVGIFFDDWVGQHIACDALDLGAGGLGGRAVGQGKLEIFALANSRNLSKSELAQGIVNGLALRIQDRCLQSDIDMRLHHP